MAKLEKTVLDILYLIPEINQIYDFERLRWNKDQLQSKVDEALLNSYLSIFNKYALHRGVMMLKEFLNA